MTLPNRTHGCHPHLQDITSQTSTCCPAASPEPAGNPPPLATMHVRNGDPRKEGKCWHRRCVSHPHAERGAGNHTRRKPWWYAVVGRRRCKVTGRITGSDARLLCDCAHRLAHPSRRVNTHLLLRGSLSPRRQGWDGVKRKLWCALVVASMEHAADTMHHSCSPTCRPPPFVLGRKYWTGNR